MTRKRRTWRWVSRGVGNDEVCIWTQRKKPKLGLYAVGLWDPDVDGSFGKVCHKEFKKLTGITIPEGECLKVEFTARVV